MLRFDYQGTTYAIGFSYEHHPNGRITTEAAIYESEKDAALGRWKDDCLALGYAECHPFDNFAKETGRTISLERTLRGGWHGPDYKEFRAAVWEAYRNRSRR